ncbi:MAG: hypothetical protein WCO33_02790 [bacterium]
MSKLSKFFVGLTGSLSLLLLPSVVNAGTSAAADTSGATGTTALPSVFAKLFGVWTIDSGGTTTGVTVTNLIMSILTLLFIVVFIVAIVYTFLAAIKYIRSEGNEQKVEEAKNAVKAVLFGVGAMFVAILGIILINALFGGASDPTSGLGTQISNIIKFIQTGK